MDIVRLRRSLLAAALAGAVVAPSIMAAPPECGRKACREEIDACVDSECAELRGSEHSQCKRACVDAVQSACDADPTVCNPEVTTTTVEATTTTVEVTTSTTESTSSTSTTLIGSPSGVFIQ